MTAACQLKVPWGTPALWQSFELRCLITMVALLEDFLTAVMLGVFVFAIDLAFQMPSPGLIYIPLGVGSLYFILQRWLRGTHTKRQSP